MVPWIYNYEYPNKTPNKLNGGDRIVYSVITLPNYEILYSQTS